MAGRRRTPSLMSQALTGVRLGIDAWTVIALRLARLSAGGAAANLEAQRMVAEKSAAAAEAQFAAALALATGNSKAAGRKAASVYRRRVKANRRRLARKK